MARRDVPNWQTEWLPRLGALAQDRRLSVLVTLLLTLLVANALARLTWMLLPAPQQTAMATLPAVKSPARGASAAPAKVSVSRIEQLHLFGEAAKSPPKTVAKVVDAPDTRLNLKLHGVLASSDPANARAIIADGKGMEDAYAVEDKLPGNAVLKEIYADRIILEYRGRLETLRLPKQVDKGVSSQQARGTSRRGAASAISASTANTGALLRQYRDALTTDPQSVMDLVRAEPVRDRATGKLKGYRLRPGRDRQLLSRFGLRAGDVVTSINGIPMDNPLKALELMRDISTISQVNLEVERNGSLQSFSFQIE